MSGLQTKRIRAWLVTVLVTTVTLVACEMRQSTVDDSFQPLTVDLKSFTFSNRPAHSEPRSQDEISAYIVRATAPEGHKAGRVLLYRAHSTAGSESPGADEVYEPGWTLVGAAGPDSNYVEDTTAVAGRSYSYRLSGMRADRSMVEETTDYYRIPNGLWVDGEVKLSSHQVSFSRIILTNNSRLHLQYDQDDFYFDELEIRGEGGLSVDCVGPFRGTKLTLTRVSGKLNLLPGTASCTRGIILTLEDESKLSLKVSDAPEMPNVVVRFHGGLDKRSRLYSQGMAHSLLEISGVYQDQTTKKNFSWLNPVRGTFEFIVPGKDPGAYSLKPGFIPEGKIESSSLTLTHLKGETRNFKKVTLPNSQNPEVVELLSRFNSELVALAQALGPADPQVHLSGLEREETYFFAYPADGELIALLTRHLGLFRKYWAQHSIKEIHIARRDNRPPTTAGFYDPAARKGNKDVEFIVAPNNGYWVIRNELAPLDLLKRIESGGRAEEYETHLEPTAPKKSDADPYGL